MGKSSFGLLTAALLSLVLAGSAQGSPVELTALLPAPVADGHPVEGTLRLHPAGGVQPPASEEDRSYPLTVKSGRQATVQLDLTPGSLWKVSAEVPGYWGEHSFLVEEGKGTALSLFPVGAIQAEIRVPRGEPRNGDIQIKFEPTPEARLKRRGEPMPEGTLTCPVDKEGRLLCEIPAGLLDLRIRRQGFASAFRWGAEIPVRKTLNLGLIELKPGASVLGRLEIDGRLPEGVKPKVELLVQTDRDANRLITPRLETLSYQATPDARGFFLFEGVRAGSYVALATAPGFAPARALPVRVFEGRETMIEPAIRLAPPASVEVRVDPPSDAAGRPWHVSLYPLDRSVGAQREGVTAATDPTGRWVRQGVFPGRYSLVVEDESENSRWFDQWIEVELGMAPIEVDIPIVKIRGKIACGSQLLQARITFGGPRGDRQVQLYSNAEGLFEGALPREGRWVVSALFERNGSEQILDPVEVRRKPGEEAAWIDLEVDDTRLEGVVLDERGKPVSGATVAAQRKEEGREESEAVTDAQGRFHFDGLPEGDYKLRAAFERSASDPAEVQVKEGPLPEVRLVLTDTVLVQGRIVSPAGPVPAALVTAFPEVPPSETARVDSKIAGAAGEFDIRVVRSARNVLYLVQAPGFAARFIRIPLNPDQPVEIPVSEIGGTLVLDTPPEGLNSWPILRKGGDLIVPFRSLDTWADFHGGQTAPATGGRWVLPMMEVGDYTLCASRTGPCQGGVLQPGGNLTLAPKASGEPEEKGSP